MGEAQAEAAPRGDDGAEAGSEALRNDEQPSVPLAAAVGGLAHAGIGRLRGRPPMPPMQTLPMRPLGPAEAGLWHGAPSRLDGGTVPMPRGRRPARLAIAKGQHTTNSVASTAYLAD